MGGDAGVLKPDLLIVGAGPAGVSAALWSRTRGLAARVIERAARPGGQLHAVHFHPTELPGIEAGDGPALAAAYARQLEAEGVEVRFDCGAAALEVGADAGAGVAVRTDAGERFEARTVLVATGVRRRRLGVPGERELEGRGVSPSATRDRAVFAGRPVAVIGGGDAAHENALLLAEVGCDVTLVVRDRPRARADFRERVARAPRIRVLGETRVIEFLGGDALVAVRVEGPGGRADLPVEGAVIKIGAVPNTEWCRSVLAHDDQGYLRADPGGRTSHRAVWAAGDVARPALPSIVVAQGAAALAVASIERALRAVPGGGSG